MITCHEEVTRGGDLQPCDEMAVAMRRNPEDGEPYPVCARHCRADMVPLAKIAADQEAARLRVFAHMMMEWRRSLITTASLHSRNPERAAFTRAQLEIANDIFPIFTLAGLTEYDGPRIYGVFDGGRS